MSSGLFTILTVCTGNICRSPLAEQLLARELADIPEITVESAGTYAMVGSSMQEKSQAIARELGVPDPGTHRARQMTSSILESADLIVALARDHRRAIVEESPRVARRVFTLREFARLVAVTTDEDLAFEITAAPDSDTVSRLRAAVSAVVAGRSVSFPPEDLSEEDVVDPYGRSDETYALSTSQIVPAVNAMSALLHRAVEVPL